MHPRLLTSIFFPIHGEPTFSRLAGPTLQWDFKIKRGKQIGGWAVARRV